jgi:hypothetical protein
MFAEPFFVSNSLQASASVPLAFVRRAASAPEVTSPEKESLVGENEPSQPLGIWKRLEDSLRRESELAADVERNKKELSSLNSRMEMTLEQSDEYAKAAKESMSQCQDMEATCATLVREMIRLKVQSNRLHDIILQCQISRTGNVGLTVEIENKPQPSSDKQMRVARLFEGGAAWKSKKIKSGDVVLAVDGISASSMTKDEVQNMFAGPVGTPIILKLKSSTPDTEYMVVLERLSLDGENIASEEIFEKSFRAIQLLRESVDSNRPISEGQASYVSANNFSSILPDQASEVLRLQSNVAALESSVGAAERDKASLARQLTTALDKISMITMMHRPSELDSVVLSSHQAGARSPLEGKSELGDSQDDGKSITIEYKEKSPISSDINTESNVLARKLECAELAWFNAEEELTRARAVFDMASEEAKARLEEAHRKNTGSIPSRVIARLAEREGEQKKILGTESQLLRELNAARALVAAAERDKASLARQLSQALEKMMISSKKIGEDSTPVKTSFEQQCSVILQTSQLEQSLYSSDTAAEAKHLKAIAAAKGVNAAGLEEVLNEIKSAYASKMSIARRELAGREEAYSSSLMQAKKVLLDVLMNISRLCI